MTQPIRVLIVEDRPDDARLMLRELRAAGYDPDSRQVVTKEAFLLGLEGDFEVILADYTLPQFSGLGALELLKASGKDIPFIIVSGTIGEELAVEAIKKGAADYLLKDRLARLGPAVRQALEQQRLREKHQLAQEHLRAREEAERASAAKSEFLSRMSHELRTPLNAILGFGQLLELEALTGKQHESVAHILDGGRYLLQLINEILDLSSVERGYLTMCAEELDVREIVRTTFALLRPLAAQRGIVLDLCAEQESPAAPESPLPCVTADRQRLSQVLINLLSNAIKYNVPGGSVTVGFQVGAGRLRVRVSDTGVGIPVEERVRLFMPFERLNSVDRSIEGTGLGLALSKHLMKAMGGDLGIEDPPMPPGEGDQHKQGCVFWFELPLIASTPEIGEGVEISPELLAAMLL